MPKTDQPPAAFSAVGSGILADLRPRLADERYSFAAGDDLADDAFALIREDDGPCVIRSAADGEWARISLGAATSLDFVGLTAELSRRLADAGISANIVAALRHDHIFVPWHRRYDALALLGPPPPA